MKIKVIRKQLSLGQMEGWSRLTVKVPLWLRSFENYTQFIFEYNIVGYKKKFQKDWKRFSKLKRNNTCDVNQDTDNMQLQRIGLWEI